MTISPVAKRWVQQSPCPRTTSSTAKARKCGNHSDDYGWPDCGGNRDRRVSTGAASDIQQATNTARAMVTQWGMSDKLGMVLYGDSDDYVFLGKEISQNKTYSEQTASRSTPRCGA
ncbi:MAG: hypothetical protein Ct9H300mP32_4100 [Verrucomicrobiota bacterium]|nr:MAG: hypothetical protein Ct9H300mP32_4100 [Verrucomicrobiota bacterium]